MMSHSMLAVRDFNDWLGNLPGWKVLVPGNHETYLNEEPSLRSTTSNGTVLLNEGIEVDGLGIWGSPITPGGGGALCVRSAEERRHIYAAIPEGIDILITHCPPYGILDAFSGGPHCGDVELLEAVKRVRPRLHIFWPHSWRPGDLYGGRSDLSQRGDVD
jgi:Icc-related predicted phosphoesterase